MMNLAYDLHIHSCLSPCGDDDMTPANIAGKMCIRDRNNMMPVTNNILEYAQNFVSDARRCMVFPPLCLFRPMAPAYGSGLWFRLMVPAYCSSLLRSRVMPELIRNNKSINTIPAAYRAW